MEIRKCTVIFLLLALMTLPSQAQEIENWMWDDNPQDVSVSAGPLAGSYFLIGWMFDFINAVDDRTGNAVLYGNYSVQYHYQLKSWFRIGFKGVWEGHGYSVYQTTERLLEVGNQTQNWASLMGSFQFTYINREHVKLYSGVDLGMGMLALDTRYDKGALDSNGEKLENKCEIGWMPAVDITPIGVAFGGRRVFGFVETNIGLDALIKAGVGMYL